MEKPQKNKKINKGQQTLESMSYAKVYNQWLLVKFQKYLSGQILEVGCGIGNFTKLISSFGQVTAVDIEPDYIKQTKKKVQEAHVGLGDIEKGKLFFKDKKFDSIVCLNVLEHIKDDGKAISNIVQLLKPDGVLVLLVPSHQFLYGEIDRSIGHHRRYDKEKINKVLFTKGLQVVFSERINFLGAIGWFVSGRVLKNPIVGKKKIKLFNLVAPIGLLIEKFYEPILGTSILVIAKKKS